MDPADVQLARRGDLGGEIDDGRHPPIVDHQPRLFLVLRGALPTIRMEAGDVELGPGQMYVVPRGVQHQPVSANGAEVVLIEPSKTVNTGDNPSELTTAPLIV